MKQSEAFLLAKRKARYSDYDWIVWMGRDGSFNAERASSSSIKKALLSVGTQLTFNLIESRTSFSHIMCWRMGINAMNLAKRRESKGW